MRKDATEAKHRVNVIYTAQTRNRWNNIEYIYVHCAHLGCMENISHLVVCEGRERARACIGCTEYGTLFSAAQCAMCNMQNAACPAHRHRHRCDVLSHRSPFVCTQTMHIYLESNKFARRTTPNQNKPNQTKLNSTKRQLSMHFHITFTIIVGTHCDKHIRFDRHSSNDLVSLSRSVRVSLAHSLARCLCVCRSVEFLFMSTSTSTGTGTNELASKQTSKQTSK